jgi:hypothetical protein
MIRHKTGLVGILLLAIAISILIQVTEATAMDFTVHGGDEVTKSLSLAVDDHVLIKFTVVGTSESSIHFYMTYPNGTEKDFGNQGDFNYSFICDAEGEYALHFSNAGSSEDKLVTLDYEIDHYILGIPQMLFLAMIIAIVCVAAVAVFIFMGKPH